MHLRRLSATLALVGLAAVACDDATQEQSPGEVLTRDTALANDLRQIDTSSFAEAADVAMAFNTDSALPPAAPARSAPAAPAVPMRVDRGAPPPTSPSVPSTPASSVPPTRSPLRPKPATIHPDPLPGPTLPPARTRPNEGATSNGAAASAAASAAAILERVPGATLAPPAPSDPCRSPASSDQRRCLMTHLAHSDAALDRTYRGLIADLKRAAGTPAGAPEPRSVKALRDAQRAWLVYRDTECRRRNRDREGPLWAPIRAQCLGEFSGVREAELARARHR